MHCIKCGGEVPEDSKFCHRCGAKLKKDWTASEGNDTSASSGGSGTGEEGSSLRRKALVVGLIAGVVLSILALSTVGWSLGSRSPDSSFSSSSLQEAVQEGSSDSSPTSSDSSLDGSKSPPRTVQYVDGEITSIDVPSEIEEGKSVEIPITVKNTGNKGGYFKVKSGDLSEKVHLAGGSSHTVRFKTEFSRNDDSVEFSVFQDGETLDTVTKPINVLYVEGKITNVDLPSEIVEGEKAKVEVRVKNTGNKGANLGVKLDPNHSGSTSRQVWLGPESSQKVTLSTTPDRNDSNIEISLAYDGKDLDSESESVSVKYDEDDDGLFHSKEVKIGTNPEKADTDKDGLSDRLEVKTLDSYGADPLRRDIFVEIDRMDGVRRLSGIREWRLKNAFNNAPIKNPNGSKGIDLHLYYDDIITPGEKIDFASNEFREYKRRYHDYVDGFRWALFAGINEGKWWEFWKQYGGFAYGEGFVVDPTLPLMPFAHTFMHELGHSLGLVPRVYGGIDSLNWPWNYSSVMNYSSQLYSLGLELDYSRGGDFNDWEYLQREGFTNYWRN